MCSVVKCVLQHKNDHNLHKKLICFLLPIIYRVLEGTKQLILGKQVNNSVVVYIKIRYSEKLLIKFGDWNIKN